MTCICGSNDCRTRMTCICGSNDFNLLGQLGRLTWLRCRSCGLDSSIELTEQEIEELEE